MRTDRFSQKHRLLIKMLWILLHPSERVQVSSLAIVVRRDRQAAKETVSSAWGLITDPPPVWVAQEMRKGG